MGGWRPRLGRNSRWLQAWDAPSVCGGLEVALPVSIHTQSTARSTLSLCTGGKDYRPYF